MGVEYFGDVIVHGNFAEVQNSKPKDFDYLHDAKWMEDYPFTIREKIGSVVCSCKRIEVHYAPYYGWNHFHLKSCNLLRVLHDRPQLANFWAYDHLPSIAFSDKAVPKNTRISLYVSTRSRKQHIKVRSNNINNNQLSLIGA